MLTNTEPSQDHRRHSSAHALNSPVPTYLDHYTFVCVHHTQPDTWGHIGTETVPRLGEKCDSHPLIKGHFISLPPFTYETKDCRGSHARTNAPLKDLLFSDWNAAFGQAEKKEMFATKALDSHKKKVDIRHKKTVQPSTLDSFHHDYWYTNGGVSSLR